MNYNLTNTQNDYAYFLPAISGFYSTFIGKQRFEEYVEYGRVPKHFANGVESLNWLAPEGLWKYKWSLHSAGHASLDLQRFDGSKLRLRLFLNRRFHFNCLCLFLFREIHYLNA